MELTVLRQGRIIDGTGRPAFLGDVAIRGDRIEAVERFVEAAEAREIDCRGLAVAPGFIDAHSHGDLQVLEGRREKLAQGVTAEVVGNCGFSPYPMEGDGAGLREFAGGILGGEGAWGWRSAQEYLEEAARRGSAHVVSLAGHGSLRVAAAGHRQGALTAGEMDRLEGLLDDALAAGAAGLSTGLMYAPGSSAPFEELERLCRIVARRGKIHATHMRDYFSRVVEALEEQIELARRTGCRLQISHLQIAGSRNWHLQDRLMERMERARAEGIDIAFDCYPYTAGSTVITQALPQWALDGGLQGLMARLRDAAERKKIAAAVRQSIEWRWSDIVVSAAVTEQGRRAVGRSLAELAEERAEDPVSVMLDLIFAEGGQVIIVTQNQCEENLRRTITHPLALVGSDGFYVRGKPHPRLYGTFPFLLGAIVRRRRWMSLEEAVHRITQAPAERFGMERRGVLARGAEADVTVFDPETTDSPATYERPEQPPSGIRYVFRGGRLTWRGGAG
ncbi:MAG: dihydroorotase [Bryobacteraceae bacterium]|nr:MAG: dihydroorotase [Bryobacteraceae bacterium]